ncbi:hypothetical protein BS47DRAFT_1317319 [Hydnum rufescens UP504]|uniref:SHSP domain-containing protein n=1 Tax=Hydnum rufescens UP504 TaxID=1448309 RepID=A0A9P6AXG0_9AGAM|nr:hypothetical protein BS47DRAFT_1317319 [Hydnum rufescens UP504]
MVELASASQFSPSPRAFAPLIRSWEAFDSLFERAFAPAPVDPANQYTDTISTIADIPPTPSLPAGEEPISEIDEDFNQLWNEAASRRKKMTRTVTRRRTLHQGAMPSSPSTVQEPGPKLSRRKSRFNFHRNNNSNTITATFELPDVRKEDVHVAFQFDRLTITWESVVTTERREPDRTLLRERKERKYARTLPLPPGTDFSDVTAFLEDGRLTVTYPKFPSPQSHAPLRPLTAQ